MSKDNSGKPTQHLNLIVAIICFLTTAFFAEMQLTGSIAINLIIPSCACGVLSVANFGLAFSTENKIWDRLFVILVLIALCVLVGWTLFAV